MKKINKLIYALEQVFSFVWDKEIKFNTYNSIVKSKSHYFEKIKEETKMRLSSSAFPAIFPAINKKLSIINDIISVQPMTAPVGLIFYIDYEYGKIKISNIYLQENYPYLYEQTQTLPSKIKEIFKISYGRLDGLKCAC